MVRGGAAVVHSPDARATPWRGRFHQAAFVASLPAGAALVARASSSYANFSGRPGPVIAAVVYSVALAAMFGFSALYNRSLTTTRFRGWMRWLDHAAIYVVIAASYTPVCAVLAPHPWDRVTLAAIWSAACAGVVVKCTSLRRFRRLGGVWYVAMGWASLAILPMLVTRMTRIELALLAAGGLLYTAGVVVLFRRQPNARSGLYGYHEVWHGFVVAAGACHFAMQWLVLG